MSKSASKLALRPTPRIEIRRGQRTLKYRDAPLACDLTPTAEARPLKTAFHPRWRLALAPASVQAQQRRRKGMSTAPKGSHKVTSPSFAGVGSGGPSSRRSEAEAPASYSIRRTG